MGKEGEAGDEGGMKEPERLGGGGGGGGGNIIVFFLGWILVKFQHFTVLRCTMRFGPSQLSCFSSAGREPCI